MDNVEGLIQDGDSAKLRQVVMLFESIQSPRGERSPFTALLKYT